MITQVDITKQALKALRKAPSYIQQKFQASLVTVSKIGVEETKKVQDGTTNLYSAKEKVNARSDLISNGEPFTS